MKAKYSGIATGTLKQGLRALCSYCLYRQAGPQAHVLSLDCERSRRYHTLFQLAP